MNDNPILKRLKEETETKEQIDKITNNYKKTIRFNKKEK